MNKFFFGLLLITLSVLFQSCNSVRYKKINLKEVNIIILKEVNTSRLLKNKLRNKKHPFKIYIHTVDSSGAELDFKRLYVPTIKDTILRGMFMPVDTAGINQYYYQKLKGKRGGKNCKTRVAEIDGKANLNQLHIYVEDTAKISLHKPYGINANKIKRLEKVKRFDKRWLWLFVGVPLFSLVFLFIYGAVTVSQNLGKLG